MCVSHSPVIFETLKLATSWLTLTRMHCSMRNCIQDPEGAVAEDHRGGYEQEIIGLYRLSPESLRCKREDATVFNTSETKAIGDIFPTKNLPAKTLGFHVERFKAGERSGTHRHSGEALIFIIEGGGFSTIQGVRVEWETFDTVFIPPMTWHSHEATIDSQFVAMWNAPLLEGLGLYYNEELADPDLPGTQYSRRTTLYPAD
jgi:quercetin dioxygenase-like cupin family protein